MSIQKNKKHLPKGTSKFSVRFNKPFDSPPHVTVHLKLLTKNRKNPIMKIQLKSTVEVKDSLHSHITPGMTGTVTGHLKEGYEVYFKEPLDFTPNVKSYHAHVFMRPQDIALVNET